MQVHIGYTKFNDEWRPAKNLDFLMAVIGEKVTVTTEFYYEDITYMSENLSLIINPPSSLVGTNTNPQELVYSSNPTTFNNYNVGDTITFSTGGTHTVTEVISGSLIRCGGVTFVGTLVIGNWIANVTPFNGVKWAYNILFGAPNYNSLIDGELQQLKCATADASNVAPVNMFFNGITSYQIGGATIQGVSSTNQRQTFKLIHTTVITPWFLASQWNALLLGIPPVDYSGGNCPNYVYKVELLRALSNPTSIQALSVNKPANVGWFGESFNGNPTNYSVYSFTIQKTSDFSFIPKLIFDEDLNLKINIRNTVNTPFSNNNTKYCIHFVYLPESETLYQNNGRTLSQNFVFDRRFTTVGAAQVNGDNFGTVYQVIKNTQASYISSSEIQINATISLGATAKSIIQQGDFSRYMIWVTTENHALGDLLSDRVPLLVQVNEFDRTTVVSDLINADVFFKQHPFNDITDNIENDVEVFPVDDIAVQCNFRIDIASYPDDGIKIKTIRPKIVLRKTGSPDIILDDTVINTSGFPYIGLAQNIAFTQDRVFKIPAGEIRKVITIARDYAADTANGFTNWSINWPFMVRWAYYIALLNLPTPIPADLVDTSEDHNGLNEFWHRFTTLSGWELKFEIDFTFEQNGATAIQSFTRNIVSYDFEQGPDYDDNSIKFYDNDTNVELVSGGIKRIQGWKSSRIEAVFNKLGAPYPALADVVIVIWMETFESGGVSVVRRISSKYALDSQSWFLSTDGSGKVLVTNPNPGEYKGVALINHAVIPQASKFSFYARLYDATPAPCSTGVVITLDGSGDVYIYILNPIGKNCTIYWGDGTSTVATGTGLVVSYTNTYASGKYTLYVCGNVETILDFRVQNFPDTGMIRTIDLRKLSSAATLGNLGITQVSLLKNLLMPEDCDTITSFQLGTNTEPTSNSVLKSLDLRNQQRINNMTIYGMNELETLLFRSDLLSSSVSIVEIVETKLNIVLPFSTTYTPNGNPNRYYNSAISNVITVGTVDSIIDMIYANKNGFNNTVNKGFVLSNNNPAPTGIYQAPTGYIQANAITVGNDGSPATPEEKRYILENQNNDNTVIKKYKWGITVN